MKIKLNVQKVSEGGGGTSDYNNLNNKPSINEETLSGNKTSLQLGLQDTLVSGQNIKTINGNSILGNGNIEIEGGSSGTTNHAELDNLDYEHSGHTGFQPAGNYVEDNNYVHTDNNFSNAFKEKLNSLSNYDDTDVKQDINSLKNNKANKNEIPDVSNFITRNDLPTKVSDLQNDSGFITQYIESDPTVPSHVKNIKQDDIENWNNKSDFSGNYNDLTNKPTIPSQVTEATVSGWGFTKNTGTYSKPSSGIPKSDLTSTVQASLNKADSALQTEQYTGTYSKPSGGIPKTDLASAVQTSLGKADTALQEHQDISVKLDTSKVKNVNSTTAGDVYDVRYINSMIGNIETILTTLTTGNGGVIYGNSRQIN